MHTLQPQPVSATFESFERFRLTGRPLNPGAGYSLRPHEMSCVTSESLTIAIIKMYFTRTSYHRSQIILLRYASTDPHKHFRPKPHPTCLRVLDVDIDCDERWYFDLTTNSTNISLQKLLPFSILLSCISLHPSVTQTVLQGDTQSHLLHPSAQANNSEASIYTTRHIPTVSWTRWFSFTSNTPMEGTIPNTCTCNIATTTTNLASSACQAQ